MARTVRLAVAVILLILCFGAGTAISFSIQIRYVHAPSLYNVVVEPSDFNMTSFQAYFVSMNQTDVYVGVENTNSTTALSGGIVVTLENSLGMPIASQNTTIPTLAPHAQGTIFFDFTYANVTQEYSSALVQLTG